MGPESWRSKAAGMRKRDREEFKIALSRKAAEILRLAFDVETREAARAIVDEIDAQVRGLGVTIAGRGIRDSAPERGKEG